MWMVQLRSVVGWGECMAAGKGLRKATSMLAGVLCCCKWSCGGGAMDVMQPGMVDMANADMQQYQ
jgi:hypothetical protein